MILIYFNYYTYDKGMVERIPKPKEAEMSLNLDLVASMAERAKAIREANVTTIPEAAAITVALNEANVRGDRERDAYRNAIRRSLRPASGSRKSAPLALPSRRERLAEKNLAENGHAPDLD